MTTVKVTSEYQLAIPQAIRDALNIKPGETFQVLEFDGRIEFIPLRTPREMRGFLRGINTDAPREND